jgi:hypothetical protein
MSTGINAESGNTPEPGDCLTIATIVISPEYFRNPFNPGYADSASA